MDDEGEMAGLFNSSFASRLIQEQSGELQTTERVYLRSKEGLSEQIQVRDKEVKKQQGKLRDDKAPRLDNMHPGVLREVAEQIRSAWF